MSACATARSSRAGSGRARRGRESASFEYERAWLEHPERFAIEPALQRGRGPFHTGAGKPLFGAIGDSAPL